MPRLLLWIFVLGTGPAAAAPQIHTWQTENGARVYFVRAAELPMADIRVVFDAGSARDGPRPGLAGLTNMLLAEGARGLPAHALSERFEQVGAQYTAGSARDMAWVGVRSLSEQAKLDTSLSVLADLLQHPDFAPEAIERERSHMLTGIKQRQQDPAAIAEDTFYETLYARHPYGSPPQGTEPSLKAVVRKDVIDFHRRYYCARNALVAVVGDLTLEAARALAARIVKDLPPGEPAPALPKVPATPKRAEIKIAYPSTQTHVWIGGVGITRTDPDFYPLYVANHSLGGGGFISRLYKAIREKRGLSYSVYSYYVPMRAPGPFIAALQTANHQAPEAAELLQRSLAEFADAGPTAAEIEASVKNITGGFPLRIDSNREIIEHLVLIGFYGLPLDYLETYVDRIKAATRDRIRDALQRRFKPMALITVSVGPGKAGPEPPPAATAVPSAGGQRH
jgi:zinc protease